MKKSRELKKQLLEQFKEGNAYSKNLSTFKSTLQELIDQVEMETRLEKNQECEQNAKKKITIWAKITDMGDGSAINEYYLTEEEALESREAEFEEHGSTGFAEDCIYDLETFEGSDIHKKAIENREKPWEMNEEKALNNKKAFFQKQG